MSLAGCLDDYCRPVIPVKMGTLGSAPSGSLGPQPPSSMTDSHPRWELTASTWGASTCGGPIFGKLRESNSHAPRLRKIYIHHRFAFWGLSNDCSPIDVVIQSLLLFSPFFVFGPCSDCRSFTRLCWESTFKESWMEEVTELMLPIESNTLAVGGFTMSHNGGAVYHMLMPAMSEIVSKDPICHSTNMLTSGLSPFTVTPKTRSIPKAPRVSRFVDVCVASVLRSNICMSSVD